MTYQVQFLRGLRAHGFLEIAMNYQRVTVSLPKDIYGEKIDKTDPIKAFFALRKITTKRTTKQILAAIRKGRT